MRRAGLLLVIALLAGLVIGPGGRPGRRAHTVAALQVALRALKHYYSGGVDGMTGPPTELCGSAASSVAPLHAVDGVVGPGRAGRSAGAAARCSARVPCSRPARVGRGCSAIHVSRRGYDPGGATAAAVGRRAVEKVPGAARAATVDGAPASKIRARAAAASTRGAKPAGAVRFLRPVDAPMGDGFGYLGGRRHAGIDFPGARWARRRGGQARDGDLRRLEQRAATAT